jgi:membrane-associated phospholipid phosphatase
MELLLSLDRYFFELIHFSWQNDWLDGLMPIVRNKWTWFPLYLALAIYWIKINRTAGLIALLCFGLSVGLADVTSSRLVKKQVKRERPCRVYKEIRGLVSCGGGYSFTSSHATNHAAMATFVFLLVGSRWGRWKWLLALWAGLIGLAQVYVGVHFPADVIGGFLLGGTLGYLVYKLYLRLPERLRF